MAATFKLLMQSWFQCREVLGAVTIRCGDYTFKPLQRLSMDAETFGYNVHTDLTML